jgi:hypothetical protein
MELILICTACDKEKPVDGFIESERMEGGTCIDCVKFLDALLEKSVEKKSVSETEIRTRRRSRSRSPRGERVEESKKRKDSASVSPASSQQKEKEKEVKGCFLGRLSPKIGDLELLRILTERYGPVKSLHRPERQKKYCFVFFVDSESARKLMRDPLELHGIVVNVDYHVPAPMGGESRHCVVQNIPPMSNEDFTKIVENRFGKVVSLKRAQRSPFCFLQFAKLEAARELVRSSLWEVQGEGGNVNICYGEFERVSPASSQQKEKEKEGKWCYIGRLTPKIGDLELLRILNERYGPVKSLHRAERQKHYCFVLFVDLESARKLLRDHLELHGVRVNAKYRESNYHTPRESRQCVVQNLPPMSNADFLKIVENRFGKVSSFQLEEVKGKKLGFLTFAELDSAVSLVTTNLWEVNGNVVYGEYKRGNQNEPPSHSRSLSPSSRDRRRPRSCSQDRTDEESVKRIRPDDDGFRDFVHESTEVLLQSAESPVSDRVVLHRACDDAQRLEEEISQARKHVTMMESVLIEERKRWTMVLSELMNRIEQEQRAWAKGMDKLHRAAKIKK